MKIPGFFNYISLGVFYKLSGFVRVILQMRYLSDSEISDIFWQSNKILMVCRRPIISGTFQSLFSLYYEKYRTINKEKQFASFCLVYLSLLFIFLAIMIGIFSNFFAILFNIKNILLFQKNIFFFLPIIPGMFLLYLFKSLADLQGKFFFSSSSATIGNIFFILCVLLFAQVKSYFNGFLFGSLLYCFFQVIFLFFAVRKSFDFDKSFYDKNFMKDFLKIQYESLIPVSEVITGAMAAKMGKGIVSHIDYAHKCLQFIFSYISDSLIGTIVPVLSKNQNCKENIKNIFMISHIIASPLALLLGFYGGEISLIILRKSNIENFQSFTRVISILSFSSYFYIMNKTISSILISKDRLERSLLAQIFNAILNVIFSIIFSSHKQFGIAWASNISSGIQFLISFYSLKFQEEFLSSVDQIYFFLAPIIALLFIKERFFIINPTCIISLITAVFIENKRIFSYLFIIMIILSLWIKKLCLLTQTITYIIIFFPYLKFLL